MEEFFKKIYDFLNKNKNPHLHLPEHVNSILEERNSDWSFILEMENSTNADKELAILNGGIDTSRIVTTNASGQYPALGGGLVQTPYPADTIFDAKDNTRLFNKISGISVDCMAAQLHHAGATEPNIIKQVVYKDASGEVSVSSKDFYLNFLLDFIKNSPSRVFEMHITTDNKELFSKRMYLKENNPYYRKQPIYIDLEKWYLPDNSQSIKIVVPIPYVIARETILTLPIPATTKVTVGFRISAFFSESNAIKNELKPGVFLENLNNLSSQVSGNQIVTDEPVFSGISKDEILK